MSCVTVNAYAKINLSLDIVGKRADGYHLMDMVMQSVSLCDTLHIARAKKDVLFSCSEQSLPQGDDNLAVRAANAFFSAADITGGASIRLIKKIPSGAGMAGGSADAAAVLVGLNALYETAFSQEELCGIGLTLGADVPFCLTGATARVTGIGEAIEPLPNLPPCFFAAVKPDFSISTKEAFTRFDCGEAVARPDTSAVCRAVRQGDLILLGQNLCNVFEQTETVPVLQKVKQALLSCGAYGAVMTGSGSVIYGLFGNRKEAETAAAAIRRFGKESLVFAPVSHGAAVSPSAKPSDKN